MAHDEIGKVTLEYCLNVLENNKPEEEANQLELQTEDKDNDDHNEIS